MAFLKKSDTAGWTPNTRLTERSSSLLGAQSGDGFADSADAFGDFFAGYGR